MSGAITQLNQITENRGATAYEGTVTKDDILNERRKELKLSSLFVLAGCCYLGVSIEASVCLY